MIVDLSVKPPIPEFLMPFKTAALSGYSSNYAGVSGGSIDRLIAGSLDDFVEDLASNDVLAVVRGLDAESTNGPVIGNDVVARLMRDYPGRFLGFAGLDPHKGKAALSELERCVSEFGFLGVNFQLMEHLVSANDPMMYPIYERCLELGVVVNLHASFHFVRTAPIDICHPRNLDVVARDFPDLKILAAPPGFPWASELIAVAWRHPNVHIGLSAVRPRLLGKVGSGFEPVLAYGRSILQDRIVFGSSYPLTSTMQGVGEIRSLGLSEEIEDKWIWRNAAKMLGLSDIAK